MTLEHLLPRVEPERMTTRAQNYLAACSWRHGAVGVWMFVAPERFLNLHAALGGHTAPWGASFLVVSAMCLLAGIRRSERMAQMGLFGSTVITGALTFSLFLAWSQGRIPGAIGPASPILWIWGSSLTWKDLGICRQPLRSPFEPLRREARQARQERKRLPEGKAADA